MSFKIKDKATRDWVQLHKKIYLTIKDQVFQKLGAAHNILIPLENKYRSELKQKWTPSNSLDLIEGLLNSQTSIALFGDFHALQQSQRGHLRILRELVKKNDGARPLVLGVEFFRSKDQKWLDLYIQKKITEKQLFKKTNWDINWGFSWSHYLPLIQWAHEHKIPLVGLNWTFKEKKLASLKLRENYSSLQLKNYYKKHENALLIVIYGELHLVKSQLPDSLNKVLKLNKQKKSKSVVRVFQNYEPLYFKLTQEGLESQVEYLKSKNGDYCILNVPPWVKWQSYLLHLENKFELELDDEGIDLTDHLIKQVEFLSSILKTKVSTDEISVYSVGDDSLFNRIKDLNVKEYNFIKKLISLEKSFYLSKLQMGYLARNDINQMASLASEYVHSLLSQRVKDYLDYDKQMLKLIWIQSIKYFGSKLINHKRKTSTLEDIRCSLEKSRSQNKRKLLLMVLRQKMIEVSWIRSQQHKNFNPMKLKMKVQLGSPIDNWEASRLLGEMLGEKLFQLFRKNKLSQKQLLEFFSKSLDDEDFESFYYKIILMVY